MHQTSPLMEACVLPVPVIPFGVTPAELLVAKN